MLRRMDHPNILRLYAYYDEPKYFCLVTEICTGGELFEQVVKQKKFDEKNVQVIIKQLCRCINYFNGLGIVHRDLKPQNILLEADLDPDKIKVVDFGTAQPYDTTGKSKLKELVGTPYYVAPEVINGSYTEKCDMWSTGVITYMLLSGSLPFTGNSIPEIFAQITGTDAKFKS